MLKSLEKNLSWSLSVVIVFVFVCSYSYLNEVVCVEYVLESHIVNEHDFKFILNPGYELCKPMENNNNHRVSMLIYAHTAPSYFKRRLILRETYTKRSMFNDVRVVFMMGASENKAIMDLVQLEAGLYNDIVQENFLDSYRNLTYKAVMSMKWIGQYCNNTDFILKLDDDMIVNMFGLRERLAATYGDEAPKKTIMGFCKKKAPVMRKKGSKWYVKPEEFEENVYGEHCIGAAYVISGDAPPLVYNTSLYVKFFWIDDYYITGPLMRTNNFTYVSWNRLFKFAPSQFNYTSLQNANSTLFVHFGHNRNGMDFRLLGWKYLIDVQLKKNLTHDLHQFENWKMSDFNYLEDFSWNKSVYDGNV